METILVTGGSGHLGMSLIHWLLKKDCTIILLVRANSIQKFGGLHEFIRAVKKNGHQQSTDQVKQRIKIVVGDITKSHLGLDETEYREISRTLTAIYHSAALLDFVAPWEALQGVNIEGTRNALDLGLACSDRAEFQGFYHISTFAVAGNTTGTFYETDLDVGQQFNNSYERSKFEAEKLVVVYREKGLPISVFRPSIIVGDSKTGETRSFETLYKPLHFLSLGLYDQIPAKHSARFNLVPVDSVAEAIYKIVEKNKTKNLTYHIVNPNEITCEFLIKIASKHFGFNPPTQIPTDAFDHARLTGFRRKILAPYIPYLNQGSVIWDAENVRDALRDTSFSWPIVDEQLLGKLFDYCLKVGYIKARGKNSPVVTSPVTSGLDA